MKTILLVLAAFTTALADHPSHNPYRLAANSFHQLPVHLSQTFHESDADYQEDEPTYQEPEPAYRKLAPHPQPNLRSTFHQPQSYQEKPQDYAFAYNVHEYDEYGRPNIHSRNEARDGHAVTGQYKVQLPDCRTQIVDYYVDANNEYHADVKYEGQICIDYEDGKKHKPATVPYHAVEKDAYRAEAPKHAFKQAHESSYVPAAYN